MNDSPDNYKEITDAEADEIRNEMERLAKEEQEKNKWHKERFKRPLFSFLICLE